jgi:hypothetical protein
MNQLAPSARKMLLVTLAVAMLPALFLAQRGLEQQRETLGVTMPAELKSAPPLLAFVTAMGGGFRGVVANALWIRAVKLQDEERYFELYTLSDWITKLQPEFSAVWAEQSWNMAWNISRQFSEPADRWLWVRSGMELLRDEGLRYNPRDPLLYRELAWMFQDKIGKYTDEAHKHYKRVWIMQMYELLGSDGRPDALLNPQTEDTRRRAAILRDKYKLDPAWMKHVDEHYGPFDWRMPEAHAIYWADLGLSRCHGRPFEMLALRRVIWQTMEGAFLRGKMIEHPDHHVEFGPNLDMVPNANLAFEEMKQAEPEKRDYISRGHKNFLRDAIFLLYTHDRPQEAARWFQFARTNFTDVIPAGQGLDEFVVAEVTKDIDSANPSRVRGMLEGLIGHYLRCRAYGEDDEANGHALLARRVWEYYSAKHSNQSNIQMASLAEIETDVRAQLTASGILSSTKSPITITNSTPKL